MCRHHASCQLMVLLIDVLLVHRDKTELVSRLDHTLVHIVYANSLGLGGKRRAEISFKIS